MTVQLVAYGIAKDILAQRQLSFDFDGHTIAQLKGALIDTYPDFSKLKQLSFAVAEEYQEDSYELKEATEIVIIPPVSGG